MNVTQIPPVPVKPKIGIELEPHEASELLTFIRKCVGSGSGPDYQGWEVTVDLERELSKLGVKEVRL